MKALCSRWGIPIFSKEWQASFLSRTFVDRGWSSPQTRHCCRPLSIDKVVGPVLFIFVQYLVLVRVGALASLVAETGGCYVLVLRTCFPSRTSVSTASKNIREVVDGGCPVPPGWVIGRTTAAIVYSKNNFVVAIRGVCRHLIASSYVPLVRVLCVRPPCGLDPCLMLCLLPHQRKLR